MRNRKNANELTRRIAIPCTFPITFAYVPASFVEDDVVLGPDMLAIGNASWYQLGILMSAAHIAWLCAVAKPKGAEFRYTPNLVYNTFPWPQGIMGGMRTRIENAARLVMYARATFPGFSFAKHYTVDGMPGTLKEAHMNLDAAVFAAYGIRPDAPAAEVVGALKALYDVLVANAKPERVQRDRPATHGRRV